MLEIEQKYSRADFALLEQRLEEWGAEKGEEQDEADHYFNAPDRDFAQTDEAFRLRRIGQSNFLTYKGPKAKAGVKKRVELEIRLPKGRTASEEFIQLLGHLGYRPVAVVRKHRRQYLLTRDDCDVIICLDEVTGLGRFAEVEVVAPPEREQVAESVVLSTAAALGLTTVENRSYLEMILAIQGEDTAVETKK
jgi:adenylate cyclase, class 2